MRFGIEDRIRAAWIDFNAREWMGATVLAGHVIEALLLWVVKKKSKISPLKKPPDELYLHDLIAEAYKGGLISTAFSKATALLALSAIYAIADDLKSSITVHPRQEI
jgi:hypothetical protein